ncbi:MAG TPA: hypothetical protein VK617_10355 [Gemmatimonadaceae bacterium]|nr:hypothetical protein [Gemmatimonadaceae bacterium]
MTLVFPLSSRSRRARMVLALALFASVVFASACGSDSPTGPKNVPGTYSLRTVDESPLPFLVPEQREHVIVINSVTATLNGNNTYAVAGTGTEDGNASTVITDAGTYTQSGSTLNFTSTMLGGATYSATAKSDSIFTVSLPGGFVDSDRATFALLFEKGS